LKLRLGRGHEVRGCCFTNYCEGLDQMHKQVTCKLWDRVRLDEPDIPMSNDGKRRLTAPTFAAGGDQSAASVGKPRLRLGADEEEPDGPGFGEDGL
jgi:hypothetical protein